MTGTRMKILALALLIGGLIWGQQLIASNRDPECSLLWPGTQACLDSACCLGIPGQCPNVCYYEPTTDDCECRPRQPGGGN